MTRFSATTALRPAQRGHIGFAHYADRTTIHWFTWRHARLKVHETPNHLNHGWTLLRLEIVGARDTPLPITTTGYLECGVSADELAAAGGVAAYLDAWMDREATTRAYRKTEFMWRQGDLFEFERFSKDKPP